MTNASTETQWASSGSPASVESHYGKVISGVSLHLKCSQQTVFFPFFRYPGPRFMAKHSTA